MCAWILNYLVRRLTVSRATNRMRCAPSSQTGLFTLFAAAEASQLTHNRDPTFNAITGLNGSGKSNILDAICFVLGITNLTTVRAQNLQVCAPGRDAYVACMLMRRNSRTSSISADRRESPKPA